MKAIEDLILAKLASGPKYAKSFHHAKPVVNRLIERGAIQRVAPFGSTMKNMLELAPKETTSGTD